MPRYSWRKFDPRRCAYNLPVLPPSQTMHEVEKHFWLVEHAGLQLRSNRPGSLCLAVPKELRAWARTTIRRGEVVFDEGRILGRAGGGQVVPRAASRQPR